METLARRRRRIAISAETTILNTRYTISTHPSGRFTKDRIYSHDISLQMKRGNYSDIVAARYRDSANYAGCRYHCIAMTLIFLLASRKNSAIPFFSLLLLSQFLLLRSSFRRSLFLSSTTPVNPDSRSRRDYRYQCNQRQAKYYSILRASCPFSVSRSIYLCVKCEISIFSSFPNH